MKSPNLSHNVPSPVPRMDESFPRTTRLQKTLSSTSCCTCLLTAALPASAGRNLSCLRVTGEVLDQRKLVKIHGSRNIQILS